MHKSADQNKQLKKKQNMASEQNNEASFSRFKQVSDAEKEQILLDRNSKSTQKKTTQCVNLLNQFLLEMGQQPLDQLSNNDLPFVLENFYVSLRQKNCKEYKLQSLKCIHAGLNRYLKEKRDLDIISNECFNRANMMFKGLAKKARTEGCATIDSFKSIPDEDMMCIGNYLYQDFSENCDVNPKKLQDSVLFSIMYFLYRCRCENLHEMKKDTFGVYMDTTRREFLAQKVDKLDKNHQADSTSPANQGKIYARPGEQLTGWQMKWSK